MHTEQKEDIKLSLFINDMVVYVENPKKTCGTNISEFSKIIGYKIKHVKINCISIY